MPIITKQVEMSILEEIKKTTKTKSILNTSAGRIQKLVLNYNKNNCIPDYLRGITHNISI